MPLIKNMFKINSKTYLILGVALIVGIAVGYVFGSLAKNQAYQSGLGKGRAEIEEKYQKKIKEIYPPMPELEEIFSVSGRIGEIKDKTLILEETIYPANPFEEPKVRKWQVKIADFTELVKRIEKTPKEMAEEEILGEPISPFKEIEIEFSDFEVGQKIIAEAGENIKGKTEFEAKKVILTLMTP